MTHGAREVGPRRWRETFGRYYEDFEVGDVYEHRPGRTITETDNTWFTLLTMNNHPLHFDAVYAARSEFGRPLVNSCLTLSIVVGMSVSDVSYKAIGNLGWNDIKPVPVVNFAKGIELLASGRVDGANGAPGSSARSAFTTEGNDSYSTSIALAASCATVRLWATTAATGAPAACTAPRASTGCGGIFWPGIITGAGMYSCSPVSSPVRTATTPAISFAARVSIETILAWG